MAIIFYYTYFYCHLSGRRGSLVIGCSKTETGQHNYPDELDHVICTPWKRALTITLVTRLVSRPDPTRDHAFEELSQSLRLATVVMRLSKEGKVR